MLNQTRAPKLLGDFGEGLVTYALIRKGFEVACVDHVGADLIAEKEKRRFAVSVKTRLFRPASKESRGVVITYADIQKLCTFAEQFGMQPLFAHVACIADDRIIHLFMLSCDVIRTRLTPAKNGFSLRFGKKHLEDIKTRTDIDYSCWANEELGKNDFVEPLAPADRVLPAASRPSIPVG